MQAAGQANRLGRLGVFAAAWWLLLPGALFLPWSGLPIDPQWQLALHHAFTERWVFGRDIVFTYGPLGFLDARAPVRGFAVYFVLLDVVVAGVLLLVVRTAWRRLHSPLEIACFLLACAAFAAHRSPPHLSVVSFSFFVFFVLAYGDTGRVVHLAAAGILAMLAFYVKANTGLPLVALLLLVLAVEGACSERRGALAATAAGLAIAFAASTFVLPIDLAGYVRGAAHFVARHPEAMQLSLSAARPWEWLAVAWLAAFAVFLGIHARAILARRQDALAALLVSANLFVLFKQAFTRADMVPVHVPTFLQFALPTVGIWYLFAGDSLRRGLAVLIVALLPVSIASGVRELEVRPRADPLRGPADYLRTALRDDLPRELRFPDALPELPPAFRARIGDASVDAVAFESSLPILAGLDFAPRPVFQSYTAFDGYLDGLNADAYRADSAPRFVVYRNSSIDDRYGFFDETRTKLALLAGYELVDASPSYLLLERSAVPRRVAVREIRAARARLGQIVAVPDAAGIVSLAAEVDYSPLGWLVALLHRPPELRVTLHLERRRPLSFRLVRPIAEAGVLVDRFVGSTRDAEQFFRGHREALIEVTAVEIDSPARWAFRGELSLRFDEIEVVLPAERR